MHQNWEKLNLNRMSSVANNYHLELSLHLSNGQWSVQLTTVRQTALSIWILKLLQNLLYCEKRDCWKIETLVANNQPWCLMRNKYTCLICQCLPIEEALGLGKKETPLINLHTLRGQPSDTTISLRSLHGKLLPRNSSHDPTLFSSAPGFLRLKRGTIHDTSRLVHKSMLPRFCVIGTNRVSELPASPMTFRIFEGC